MSTSGQHSEPTDLTHQVIDHTAAPDTERRGWAGWRLLRWVPLVILLLATGGVIGLYFQPPGLRVLFAATGLQPGGGTAHPIALPPGVEMPQDMAVTMQPTDVVGLARLLPLGDVSIVAPPFGSGDARISELLVGIGDRVTRGDPVALLDNRDQLESAVLIAQAGVAVRDAALAQTRQSITTSMAEARAALAQAQAAAAEATLELTRTQSLRERGVATQSVLDTVQSRARQADLAVEIAIATLSRFDAGPLDEQADVVVAARNLDAANADLERAKRDLARARVVAPVTGTVLDVFVRPGERPGSAGIMQIGQIDQMMAEVEVYQSRVGDITVGQPVEIAADALWRTLYGKVTRIGLTVGRQSVISDDAAANTDARVVDVLVELDAESSAIASRFTGLEVLARIDTRDGL